MMTTRSCSPKPSFFSAGFMRFSSRYHEEHKLKRYTLLVDTLRFCRAIKHSVKSQHGSGGKVLFRHYTHQCAPIARFSVKAQVRYISQIPVSTCQSATRRVPPGKTPKRVGTSVR